MIQKLLLIIRHLFSNSFVGKAWAPSAKLFCLGMFFVVTVSHAIPYYSKATGSLHQLANWGTNPDGSGTAPPAGSFGLAGNVFYIRNSATPTLTASWTVSNVVLGDGTNPCSLTVGSNYVLTANMDISANATLNLTTTGNTAITFGTLATTSTVIFAEAGNQAVITGNYGNLSIDGSGNKTVSGNINVKGDFTLTGSTFVLNNSSSNTLTILGNYNQTSGVFEFNTGGSGSSNVLLSGNFNNTATATGSIRTTGTVSNGVVNFNGTGIQTLNNAVVGATSYVNYTIASGSSLRLLSNLTLTQSNQNAYTGTLTTNGTIDFSTFVVSQSGGSTGVDARVIVNSGATAITANTGGLNASVSTSQNLTRTFSTGANYIFNGTASQITGTALPGTVSSLSIINTSGVTLSQLTNVTNDFSISAGSTVNLGNSVTHTAKTITLGGYGQNSLTWGGTNSAATNKSALYFGTAPTGIVNVSTASCTAGYWNGTTSNDWNTASNWCGAVPPTSTTDVIIPSGTPFSPTIGAFAGNVRNLTINTGATLTLSTATSVLNINGNFANSGTLSTTIGSNIAIAGTAATQSIAAITTLGNISLTKTSGTATLIGALNANALTVSGPGGTLNLGAALTHTFTGDITLTAGTLNGGSSTINANSSTSTAWNGTGTNFTAGTSTVNFGGVAQTIATATTFNNLILSGSGAKTLSTAVTAANLTVTGVTATNNSNLTVSTALSGTGMLINSAGNNLTLGGTSTINTLTTTAAGNTVIYNGTAQTIVGNAYSNLNLSNSGNKTLSAATTISGNLNVATGVTLTTSNFGLTFGGNFTNSGTITAGSSSFTITGTTAQNIAGFSTTGAVAVTKTAGIASFTSSVATTGNFSINSGTAVDLGSILTHTAGSLTLNGNGQNGGTWGGSAATTAASKSALYFGSTATGILTVNAASCAAGYWTGTTSADWNTPSNWCGSALPTSTTNVIIPAGTPFMPTIAAGTTALANDITINATASLTLPNSATSVLNLSGNFVNNGTFTAAASSLVNLVGTTQSIAGGTYGNITISSGSKTFSANTIITNNLILNAGAVLNLNGITTHTTGTLTLNGAGPLLSSWGAPNSGAVNTDSTYFTGSGRITVQSPAPYPAIGNNFASYSKGVYGKTADSYLEGASPIFSAPAGTVFINVDFASYGLPSGLPAPFTLGTCDAFNSRTVATTFLGNTTAQIPATNAVFGDPCYGTGKRLSIQATYTEPICAGTSPGVITGSNPSGGTGTYTQQWSVSTTSATAGYSNIGGATGLNYTPGNLSVTTWFKRTVTSGMYTSETIVIVPVNSTPSAPTVITAPVTICAGSSTTLTVSGGVKGGNGSYTQWYSGACGSAGTLIGTGDSIIVTPTAATTYYARYTNGCGSSTCISTTVDTSVTIASSATTSAACANTTVSTALLAYSSTTGTPNQYNIVWNASPSNSFVNVPDTACGTVRIQNSIRRYFYNCN